MNHGLQDAYSSSMDMQRDNIAREANACADMLARLGHSMLGNEDWVNVHPLHKFGICCILILLVAFSLAYAFFSGNNKKEREKENGQLWY